MCVKPFTTIIPFPHLRVTRLIFKYVKHLPLLFWGFSGWYTKKQKHVIVLASMLLLCWKCHVWGLSWLALAIPCPRAAFSDKTGATSQMCRENAEMWDVMRSSEVCFVSSEPVSKAECSQSIYFVDSVPFCDEAMCRGSGNFMFAFCHFSVVGCCVSFLSKQLFAWKAVIQFSLFEWLSKTNGSTGYCSTVVCCVVNFFIFLKWYLRRTFKSLHVSSMNSSNPSDAWGEPPWE